ncbi:MAG: ABC transporter permease [Bacteroidales bacterium]|nr:ABC transporter permease [Bacteroidales bacterium]
MNRRLYPRLSSPILMASYFNRLVEEFELPVEIRARYYFNPQLDYNIYMLPGILVILVTIIGVFLTAINIVREKELGTIEQLNVTPIKKYQFITGKMIPFMVIAFVELAIGLVIGHLFFDLPMEGSYGVLFLFTFIYLLVALGFGLFLSAISDNQQQVMFVVFFFLLTFILMSGIFTPTESMPEWAQAVNVINPFRLFYESYPDDYPQRFRFSRHPKTKSTACCCMPQLSCRLLSGDIKRCPDML